MCKPTELVSGKARVQSQVCLTPSTQVLYPRCCIQKTPRLARAISVQMLPESHRCEGLLLSLGSFVFRQSFSLARYTLSSLTIVWFAPSCSSGPSFQTLHLSRPLGAYCTPLPIPCFLFSRRLELREKWWVTWALGHWEKNGGGDCLQHGILVHPLLGSSMGLYEFHQENSLFCASNELHLRGHSASRFSYSS